MTAKASLIQGLGGRPKACAVCQRTVPKGRNYGHWLLPMHKRCAAFMAVNWLNNDKLPHLLTMLQQLSTTSQIFWDTRVWPPTRVARTEEEPPNERWMIEVNVKVVRRY